MNFGKCAYMGIKEIDKDYFLSTEEMVQIAEEVYFGLITFDNN